MARYRLAGVLRVSLLLALAMAKLSAGAHLHCNVVQSSLVSSRLVCRIVLHCVG